MTYRAIFSNAARLRERGNAFILAELKKAGLDAVAPSHGLPVMAYDRFSRGAAAYEQVAQEIIAKE